MFFLHESLIRSFRSLFHAALPKKETIPSLSFPFSYRSPQKGNDSFSFVPFFIPLSPKRERFQLFRSLFRVDRLHLVGQEK
ncbi:hypothetical protein JCM9140_1392 [Halalkalibacter wakoensis JCM 9140]|uniref:Uncharacterized protein n=1 Tax=Halalkalibacter wakoensis JCM 9140 TaxID=1236970 RepID=W4Q0C6_9BACI|nr:hypothetical protein JCM9140_1392 [Halalkalibacter wakoensis JCM 9140]